MPKMQTQNKTPTEDKFVEMKCGLCGYKYRIAKIDLFSVVEGKTPPFTFEEKCPYCLRSNGSWTAMQENSKVAKVTFVFAPVPRKEIWQVTVNMPKK